MWELLSEEGKRGSAGHAACILYDGLKRNEARVLAQLRTVMARGNGCLRQKGHAEEECSGDRQRRQLRIICSKRPDENDKAGKISYCLRG